MKRPLLLAILTVLAALVLAVLPAFGAPASQETQPVIAQPAPDAAVRDTIQIVGSATHPQFQRYELYYAPFPVPSDQSWIFIGDAHFNQQPLGLLATWDTRSVPDGAYALRVRVVKADGNYIDSDARRVIVANTRPPETPTPAVTDTPLPELPPTDAPVSEAPAVTEPPTVDAPTVQVQIPTIAPTATRDVTSSPESETTPVVSTTGSTGGGSTGSAATEEDGFATSIAGQLFSSSRLIDTARKAATYTAAAFLAVGAFFALKGILVWLWYKIKP